MKILFLVGPHASGKTYAAKNYVSKNENNNIGFIDTGPIMREIHNNLSPNTTMTEWVNNMEKQYGKDATSYLISTEIDRIISNSECNKYILIGFRTIEGIIYTINHLGIEDFSVLYVDATDELLFNNYLERENRNVSFEEFKKYLDDEQKSGLEKLKKFALESRTIDYFYKYSNDDRLEEKIDVHLKNDSAKELQKKLSIN